MKMQTGILPVKKCSPHSFQVEGVIENPVNFETIKKFPKNLSTGSVPKTEKLVYRDTRK